MISRSTASRSWNDRLEVTRLMDSALACCAGGPGWIPAIGIVELQYSDDFSRCPV